MLFSDKALLQILYYLPLTEPRTVSPRMHCVSHNAMNDSGSNLRMPYGHLCRLSGLLLLAVVALGTQPAMAMTTTAKAGVYYFEGWYHDTPGAIASRLPQP